MRLRVLHRSSCPQQRGRHPALHSAALGPVQSLGLTGRGDTAVQRHSPPDLQPARIHSPAAEISRIGLHRDLRLLRGPAQLHCLGIGELDRDRRRTALFRLIEYPAERYTVHDQSFPAHHCLIHRSFHTAAQNPADPGIVIRQQHIALHCLFGIYIKDRFVDSDRFAFQRKLHNNTLSLPVYCFTYIQRTAGLAPDTAKKLLQWGGALGGGNADRGVQRVLSDRTPSSTRQDCAQESGAAVNHDFHCYHLDCIIVSPDR